MSKTEKSIEWDEVEPGYWESLDGLFVVYHESEGHDPQLRCARRDELLELRETVGEAMRAAETVKAQWIADGTFVPGGEGEAVCLEAPE